MANQMLLDNSNVIKYDLDEEKKELTHLLGELRTLNEMQQDLGLLLNEQNENIDNIQEKMEDTAHLTVQANKELESASGHKIKMAPLAIGAGIGLIGGVAVGIPLVAYGIMSTTVMGYSLIGTTLVGGVSGRSLA
tara:strand:+ start:219 stop:623 length:405 start_codon:yes stop_codon:yes gene_type:complete